MYALILPALTPFVLLATVMGLSWLEDHFLPPAYGADTGADSLLAAAAAAWSPEPRPPGGGVDMAGTPALTDTHDVRL